MLAGLSLGDLLAVSVSAQKTVILSFTDMSTSETLLEYFTAFSSKGKSSSHVAAH